MEKVLGVPFLTLQDSRARIKGSRDPLGVQPLWTRLGRRVIHNLTTVTTSLRGFTTLLLGLYFAERALKDQGEGAARMIEFFLKFEQLAAYSRVVRTRDRSVRFDEDEIRGILRVQKNLSEKRIIISSKQEWQILSNQKVNGLWGLYTVSARNSGWIIPGSTFLTPLCMDFIESEYLPVLRKQSDLIFSFLMKDREFELRGSHSKLAQALGKILSMEITPNEKRFYGQYLISPQANPLQGELWKIIKQVNKRGDFKTKEPFSMEELREIIKTCDKNPNELLAERLSDIRTVELIIAPLQRLFSFCLIRHDQEVDQVAKQIRQVWGASIAWCDPDAFSFILQTVEGLNHEFRSTLVEAGRAMHRGQYADLLRILLKLNQLVMKERGSDAWIRMQADRLHVRLPEESGPLPDQEELKNPWVNSYFMNSLKQIGFQVEGSEP